LPEVPSRDHFDNYSQSLRDGQQEQEDHVPMDGEGTG
jgi:hypothetical protein